MPHDGDAVNVAAWAVVRLRKAQPPLQLGGETVAFETGSPQVREVPRPPAFAVLKPAQQKPHAV